MNNKDLETFLNSHWEASYNDLLTVLGMKPNVINEPNDARTFEFQSETDAKKAVEEIKSLHLSITANRKGKKVSTVQPESFTQQVVTVAKKHGGKMRGFQLSWS